ncbi:MAG: glycosyltransferase [Rhodobacterales bacterium]|nr:glycosyltransferase [Rhodobacterales bacterium]
MTAPWLSVLMPIHDGAATLSRTLASLQDQCDGVEVLAVVQRSTDGSRALLEAAARHLDLTIIDAPDSRNWMRNTNIALERASAPLATMLHQDDLWRPGRGPALKRMATDHPDARLWVHAAHYIDEADRIIGRAAPPFGSETGQVDSQTALARLIVQNSIALPAAMFRTQDALQDGGLDEELWYTADWDLWLRLARLGPVSWTPEALAAFRIHKSSLTMTGSRDDADFRRQLSIPVDRHIAALSAAQAKAMEPLARASNDLNACLAGAFHGNGPTWGRTIARIVMLGPLRWPKFFAYTNIINRLRPRLRLRGQG